MLSVNFSTALNQCRGICIHTMSGTLAGTNSWFNNPDSKVSSHYGVDLQTDKIFQWVKEEHTAWAQGRVSNPTNKLVKDIGGNPNSYMISIECADNGDPAGADRTIQTRVVAELMGDIAKRNGIPLDRDHICGHREIFDQKSCPGNLSVDEIVKLAKGVQMQDDEMIIKKSEYKDLFEGKSLFQQFKDAGYPSVADVKSEVESWKATLEGKKMELTAAVAEAAGFKDSFQSLRATIAKALHVAQEVDQINAALGTLEKQLDEFDTLKTNYASLQSSFNTMTSNQTATIAAYEALLLNAYNPAELRKIPANRRAEIIGKLIVSLIKDIKINLPKLRR